MLEANGNDFPGDPEAAPMIGSAPTHALRHASPGSADHSRVAASPHGGTNRSVGDISSSVAVGGRLASHGPADLVAVNPKRIW
jgi:hypothetical protein